MTKRGNKKRGLRARRRNVVDEEGAVDEDDEEDEGGARRSSSCVVWCGRYQLGKGYIGTGSHACMARVKLGDRCWLCIPVGVSIRPSQ